MHPALRKGPLFFTNNTPHFPLFFYKKHPPFHFLPTGLFEDVISGFLTLLLSTQSRVYVMVTRLSVRSSLPRSAAPTAGCGFAAECPAGRATSIDSCGRTVGEAPCCWRRRSAANAGSV